MNGLVLKHSVYVYLMLLQKARIRVAKLSLSEWIMYQRQCCMCAYLYSVLEQMLRRMLQAFLPINFRVRLTVLLVQSEERRKCLRRLK